MNQLPDLNEAVKRIKAAGPKNKDRAVALHDYLRGSIDVGAGKKPRKEAMELLHRRALLVTKCRVEKVFST